MLKEQMTNSTSELRVLDMILDNNAISIQKISKQSKSDRGQLRKPQETETFSVQKVHRIKEEVPDVDECSNYETSEYSDYDNITYIDDKPASEIFFAESINFEAAYAGETISPEEANDLAKLYDLIDFTCTKCRKTSKNPDYFLKKADLQCSDCQAIMKFQCPQCKLLFRQFDNAVRHAKQNCQIGVATSSSLVSKDKVTGLKCLVCGFNTPSLEKFRVHIRQKHPHDESAYACSRCSKRFKSRDGIVKHVRHCGQEPHIVCMFCNYKTKRNEHLKVHMLHKHPDPDSCHGGGYDCPKCNKKYKYLMSMKSHMKTCRLRRVDNSTVVQVVEETPEVVTAEGPLV